MTKSEALAENNGRVVAECGHGSNPYRKGTRNHVAFERGYAKAKEPKA